MSWGIDLQADRRLIRSGGLLADARSLEDVVGVLRLSAREIAGSDGIAVILREEDHCHYVAEDAVEVLWKGGRFPLDACVSGWTILNDDVAVIQDVTSDPRVPHASYLTKAISSLVMVPIGSPEPVAALGAYWNAMVLLEEAAIRPLEVLAGQATQALSRIRSHGRGGVRLRRSRSLVRAA